MPCEIFNQKVSKGQNVMIFILNHWSVKDKLLGGCYERQDYTLLASFGLYFITAANEETSNNLIII